MRIAFDIGGVLSKRPDVFKPLVNALHAAFGIQVWFISDMHPVEKIIDTLRLNDIWYDSRRVVSADYKTHGEMCKAILCEQLGIDMLIDDFPGYVATGSHVRLLVMPSPTEDYYHPDWKTDGSEGNFGRRNPPESKGPGRPKNPMKEVQP